MERQVLVLTHHWLAACCIATAAVAKCTACCSWMPPRYESGQGYTASDNAQQSFQDSGAIIPYARMHVFICDPLPDPLNLAGCLLSKLKVHIQVL